MPTQVTLLTAEGRVVNGISYVYRTIPSDRCGMTPCPVFAASLNGGASYGSFPFRGSRGWVSIPANNIVGTPTLQSGAQT